MNKDISLVNVGMLMVTGALYAAEGPGPNDGVLVENALPGEWLVKHHEFEGRPLDIITTHPAFEGQELEFVQVFMPNGEPVDIGVDGGHAGFFDAKSLPVRPKLYSDKKLFDAYWDSFNSAGLTVMSGYGDGGYPLYVARNTEGQVVAARLVFIANPGGCETPGCTSTETDWGGYCEGCIRGDDIELNEFQKELLKKHQQMLKTSKYPLVGHWHLPREPEQGGVVLDILRTLAPKDAWHQAQARAGRA